MKKFRSAIDETLSTVCRVAIIAEQEIEKEKNANQTASTDKKK